MNCKLTRSSDRSGKHSDETKLKMSFSGKGKTISIESRIKQSISKKNMSKETKIKIGLFHKGRKRSKETRLKMSVGQIGRKQSKEMIQKRIQSIKENAGKIILDVSLGIFYIGIKQAVPVYGIKYINLAKMLSGHRKNKTNLMYV